ncbi:BaiN/RdsA family NAD(P)/FAD-dependent oxidoreductase [Clostridium felsineum]|uniref:3-dehydro-bile acid delta(4,6)-reductase n=1 Tax=Clostridium felsineum TaxID=36839 RepID=A0A1S8L4X3_9CLOT|nr:NAD(P)/FAD-dependent oxidoreductase [Clostridium felsineum]URZ00668.1 3-dehydro-bile acid delta(4,6)-reductase [Clostridium felsineum]URZ06692.1 3-dehydro-bile acid delta(4,6)-reductase [Clostridium felsineum]URZ11725.1 3-dehydro-bile acid delta(4,6)-reductase [Clostridium felsineum]
MAKVIVIGGGAAGMMAAITASLKHQVILIEQNEKLGKKLFITGKGRCNITNSISIDEFFENIPGNPYFLYSSLYSFTNNDLMNFMEGLGVKLKVERGGRVFPESNKSSDIIAALEKELKKRDVKVILNSKVTNIDFKGDSIKSVVTSNNEIIKGDIFILCTGGKSYPQTGSTGDGYKFAKDMGHNIVEPKPSLVPIEIEESFIGELQGLSLKNVRLYIKKDKKIIYENFGEMLFTHYGISGPIVLSGSRVVNYKKNLKAVIDLKPALDEKELDLRLQKDFMKYINKDFKNALDDLLPQKLIPVIIKLSKIAENKKVNLITKSERKNIAKAIKEFTLTIKGLRPIAEAIITAGGVDVKDIDPSTLKSKKISNLYFSGEIIDVDAYTGGFNLQIAMSTAHLAGKNI